MKNLKNVEIIPHEELAVLNGGESIWYWIAYAAGWTARGIQSDIDRMSQPGRYEWSPARPY
ncbi:hypothetical protein [Neolewinella xylanilytica]|uniref:hypothetical protein n=1 Tax=Neolewinella xylanilytica TaxID=1514080 RepID=UPI0011B0B37A|nr:hypothetical protein [Neolewinella xylanilytica]